MPELLNYTDVPRYDAGDIQKVIRSDEGFLTLVGVPTRVGVFPYRNRDGSVRRELRHPEDVLHKDSLKTLAGKPFTLGHPPVPVTPQNYSQYGAGTSSNEIEIFGDGLVKLVYNIHRQDAIDALERRSVAQLSCGYRTDLVLEAGSFRGQPYDCRQTNIRYNHHAGVPAGRAGPDCGVRMDGAEDPYYNFDGFRQDFWYQQLPRTDSSPLIFDLSPKKSRNRPMAKLPVDLFSSGIRYDAMDEDYDASFVQALTAEINIGKQAMLHNDELAEELEEARTNYMQALGRADALEDTVDELNDYIRADMDQPADDTEDEDDDGELDDDVDPEKKHKKDMKRDGGSYHEDELSDRMSAWGEAAEILTAYNVDLDEFDTDASFSPGEIRGLVVGALVPDIREDSSQDYVDARYDLIVEELETAYNTDSEGRIDESTVYAEDLQSAIGLSRRSAPRQDSDDAGSVQTAKMTRHKSPGGLHK